MSNVKYVSCFGDVIEIIPQNGRYVARTNGVFSSDRAFVDMSSAREYAENKKADLDFRHVIVHEDGSAGEVAVFASGLDPGKTDHVVKISIAEAMCMGLVPMMSPVQQFAINGYEAIERTVTPANKSSGRIYLPNAWIGKRVMVVRLE